LAPAQPRLQLPSPRACAVVFVLAFLALAVHDSPAADAPPAGLTGKAAQQQQHVSLLFLGDNGHHKPAERFAQLQPVLKQRGIDLTYTDKMGDLNPETLNQYDGLVIYSNETRIATEQEKALLDYVRW